MGKALDSMESAFENIMSNGELIYDEDFMMNTMFSEIMETASKHHHYRSKSFWHVVDKCI